MMKSFILACLPGAIMAALVPRQGYGTKFGNYFSTGSVAANSFIREATTTLVLPPLNKPHNGNLALWPGMGMSNQDLVQGLAISCVGPGTPCNLGADEERWCVGASTLQGYQKFGATYKAAAGDRLTFKYKYNDATRQYDQSVAVNGTVVSTLSTSSGFAQGWGTAMECQTAACGTIGTHHYLDTTFVMDVADPNYGRTVGLNGATGSLTTADGGKTWTAADITIQQFTFT